MFCLGCPHRCKGIYGVTALEHFSKATGSLPLGRGEGLSVLARSQSGGFGLRRIHTGTAVLREYIIVRIVLSCGCCFRGFEKE